MSWQRGMVGINPGIVYGVETVAETAMEEP